MLKLIVISPEEAFGVTLGELGPLISPMSFQSTSYGGVIGVINEENCGTKMGRDSEVMIE